MTHTIPFNDGKYNSFSDNIVSFSHCIDDLDHPFGRQENVDGNTTIKWASYDSEDLFHQLIKFQPDDWHYRTKEVLYHVNSSGYRTYEWNKINWQESIVLFGCSCVYGVGLAEDETIAYHLEQLLGRPVINLGFSSGSGDVVLHNCITVLENYGIPWGVSILWPPSNRFKYFTSTNPLHLGPWSLSSSRQAANLWKCMTEDETNDAMRCFHHNKLARQLWKSTRYCSLSFFEAAAHYTRSDDFIPYENSPLARDMLHPGRFAAKDAATKIAYYLNN